MTQDGDFLAGDIASHEKLHRLIHPQILPVTPERTSCLFMKRGALNYIFEMPDGFTFFIGTDTGRFKEETWAILKEFHFDMMILDGTAGRLDIEGSHCTAKQVRDIVARLRDEKIIDDGTCLVTNHFAHCAGMLHKDLEEFYRPLGIEPGYDGMIVKLARDP